MICLEGPDGSGKTTHSILLDNCLKYNSIPSLYSREPGGSPLGELLRSISLKGTLGNLGDILLYTLNRHLHIHETILPSQKEGKIVILDRYLLSTIVYQGNNDSNLIEKIMFLHKSFNNNLFPKITLVLNINSKVAINRIKNRSKQNVTFNYYDQQSLNFHYFISKLYNEAQSLYKGKIKVLNANLSIEEMHNNIINILNDELKLNVKPLSKSMINNCINSINN